MYVIRCVDRPTIVNVCRVVKQRGSDLLLNYITLGNTLDGWVHKNHVLNIEDFGVSVVVNKAEVGYTGQVLQHHDSHAYVGGCLKTWEFTEPRIVQVKSLAIRDKVQPFPRRLV